MASISEGTQQNVMTQQLEELSEVSNLTWEVNKSQTLRFETGLKTMQNPCTWIFRIGSGLQLRPTATTATTVCKEEIKFLLIDLELLKETLPPGNVWASFEFVVNLKTKDGDLKQKRTALPKALRCKGVFRAMMTSYDPTWTVENVKVRVEVFNGAFDNPRNMDNPDEPAMKKARVQNKSRMLTLDNLQNLLQLDDNFSDFKIKLSDGKEFSVHKAILASQSAVFSTLFKSKTSSRTLKITDLSTEAMGVILNFIYSGSVNTEWKNVAQELIYAAEKYELKILIEFCDTMFVSACESQNAIELLKTARKFKLNTAEKEIKAWVSKNMTAEEVVNATVYANSNGYCNRRNN